LKARYINKVKGGVLKYKQELRNMTVALNTS